MKYTKKIKLSIFILAGCLGFFLGVHYVLAAGCCFIQYNSSQGSCTKNVADSAACSTLAGSNYKVFYNNDPNCAGSSIATICAKATQSTTPVQSGTETTSDPTGCCSKSITGGGYAACVQSVNKSNCSSSNDKFWSGDPTCQSTTAKGWCSSISVDKGCCISSSKTCSANIAKTNCSSTNQTFISGDTACSSSQAQSACSSQINTSTTAATGGTGGTSGTGVSGNVEFTNPLKYKTVNEFATNVLGTLRSIIVVLSIIFIVLGGIFYITSAGDEKRMTAAKGAITASMIGLAVGIAAPSFLKEIYTIMGGDSSDIDKTSISGSLTLTQISLNFLDFLLAIVGVLALIMLIVGGIMYLTSAGDDDRIKTAKKIVTYSIIGIAVSLASLVVVKQIAKLLT